MAYHINYKKRRWEELEKEYHGKPPYSQVTRVQNENLTGITDLKYKVGQPIQTGNGKLTFVKKVTKKGVWVEEFEHDALDEKPKIYFIPEKVYAETVEPHLLIES